MTRKEVIEYFLSKPFSVETYPFDDVTAVFKVGGKMFGLISVHEADRVSINLKNTPDQNILMREIYEEVIPAYHQNKTHWNTVYIDRTLDVSTIHKMIDDSYDIVYKKLTKKLRQELES
ncbi:MmcQ/YjbR family DNA-binding protein [Acidaminobacter sp. JC074]|uniref:MmcQ/YjbR family DNA-binding protein n=1 Tax=Acidaminobacter sp. JC074 TaxID=2530199 RepID=UPI001F0DCAE5|nr:MmcQ/YjbR family DNA-binding protein [Acidaminobacter sp. JC074]MCH4888506.1 MmcQ/YjbR family DNA-binding protein [Acidaminobacter sp. JC074]